MTDALLCHICFPVGLWIMDLHSRVEKKSTSHGIEVLPQDIMHIIERPHYLQESQCQDPAGSWTTWWPSDHHKETQTEVVWTCVLYIRSGQKHLARHSKSLKKTRPSEKEMGRQHPKNMQAWSLPSPRGQWRTGKNGGNWLWNHLWCLNDPSSYGIDGDDDDQVLTVWLFMICLLVIAQPIVAIVLGKAHIFQLSAWMNTEQIIWSRVCLISATVYQRRKK